MITVAPPEDRSYDHAMYEPFWAAAQDLDVPISLHVDTNRPAPYVVAESNRTSRAALLANADYWVRVSLGHLILEGVFERYPRLRVGSAEHELAWVPVLPRPARLHLHAARPPGPLAPLPRRCAPQRLLPAERLPELSGRRAWASATAPSSASIRLMWGSDYPHTESTFPRSRAILERILDGVPREERRQITASNVARLYRFDAVPVS